jgi:hypothetical protein
MAHSVRDRWRRALVVHSHRVATEGRKNRSNQTGCVHGWKHILNALTIHYGGRMTAAA